jgi:hypothetical protein
VDIRCDIVPVSLHLLQQTQHDFEEPFGFRGVKLLGSEVGEQLLMAADYILGFLNMPVGSGEIGSRIHGAQDSTTSSQYRAGAFRARSLPAPAGPV